MSKARDDKRKNARYWFATTHDAKSAERRFGLNADDMIGERVGAFWIGHADGCSEGFTEDGECFTADFAETHEPGTHEELHAVLVEPRRRFARQRAS